jgi:hypothetical protein
MSARCSAITARMKNECAGIDVGRQRDQVGSSPGRWEADPASHALIMAMVAFKREAESGRFHVKRFTE